MFPGKRAKPTPKIARDGCCAHLAGMMTLICLGALLGTPARKAMRSLRNPVDGRNGWPPSPFLNLRGGGVVRGERKSPKTLTHLAKRTLTGLRIQRVGKNR